MGTVVYFASIDTKNLYVSPLQYRRQDTMFFMEADDTLVLGFPLLAILELTDLFFSGVEYYYWLANLVRYLL